MQFVIDYPGFCQVSLFPRLGIGFVPSIVGMLLRTLEGS